MRLWAEGSLRVSVLLDLFLSGRRSNPQANVRMAISLYFGQCLVTDFDILLLGARGVRAAAA